MHVSEADPEYKRHHLENLCLYHSLDGIFSLHNETSLIFMHESLNDRKHIYIIYVCVYTKHLFIPSTENSCKQEAREFI